MVTGFEYSHIKCTQVLCLSFLNTAASTSLYSGSNKTLWRAARMPIIVPQPFHPWLYMTESIYYTDTQQLLWYCACQSQASPSFPTQLEVMKVNIGLCSKFKWWQDGFIDKWLIVDPIFHLSLCPLTLSWTRFVRRCLQLKPQLSSSWLTVSTAGDSGSYCDLL